MHSSMNVGGGGDPKTGLINNGRKLRVLVEAGDALPHGLAPSVVLRLGSAGTEYNLLSCCEGRRPAELLMACVLALAQSSGMRCPASSSDVPALGDALVDFARDVRLERCDGAWMQGGVRKEAYNTKQYTRCLLLALK